MPRIPRAVTSSTGHPKPYRALHELSIRVSAEGTRRPARFRSWSAPTLALMPEPREAALSRCLLVFCALRRALLLLGMDTVSEYEYRRATRILRAQRDDGEVRLPHPRRLKRLADGDWAQVLRVALLPVPEPAPPSDPDEVIELASQPGMPVTDAIAEFWRNNGEFPSRTTLERFMSACDARLANPAAGVPWHVHLDQARELLRQEGREPSDAQPKHGRPVSFRVPPGARIPGALPQRTNRRRPATRVRCLQALDQFASEQLAAGLPLSRDAYLQWRRGTDWPSPSSMTRHGGFVVLMQQVLLARSDNATAVHGRRRKRGVRA